MLKSKKAAAAAAVIAGTLTIGGMMAYFTDYQNVQNTFTVGKISVELTEEHWDPENAKDITPNQPIRKDPALTNDGSNDEFVFLTVSVPYADIITVDDDGREIPKSEKDLFTYETKAGWTLIGQKKDESNKINEYRYAYTGTDASSMETLTPGSSTAALFDSVTFVNALEGQGLENSTYNINVQAFAIQSDYLGASGEETSPEAVWTMIENHPVS